MVRRNISNGLSDVAITSYGDSRFVECLIPGYKTLLCSYFLQHLFFFYAESLLQIRLVKFMCGIEELACLRASNFQ